VTPQAAMTEEMKASTAIGVMKGTSCIVLANALSGLLVVGLFSRMPLRAQTADQAAQIIKNLNKPAHTVVSRLTELNRLPTTDAITSAI